MDDQDKMPSVVGRYDYGNGHVKYTEGGLKVVGETQYIRRDIVDGLVGALNHFAEIEVWTRASNKRAFDALTTYQEALK